MSALWITLALLAAGFAGWPVTALVFRLARTFDDRADGRGSGGPGSGGPGSGGPGSGGPAPDGAVDGEITRPAPAPALPAEGSTGGTVPVPAAQGTSTRILRGGAIIGVLERLAVCLAILTGQPVAIAYVVAIKGLGRFAELKETPVAAERFIIGTLTSLLWAAGVAALVKVLLLG
ncbi:hypothetical protein [Arthrobacter sp. UYEF3]|uniref:hypothetical protein n=1 Tax=Arthrobacter sp. UYEF3 TaxID=1756365 RepID=UPI00339A6B06